ncbi:MAG: MarR family transcriptional regulator [Erysipelotrichaceae bacterium]|nr:MarR family transcriptional regulator [Erysipelotrichaceae bacterium]
MNRKNETLHDRFRKTAALLRRNRVREFGNYPDTQNRILSLLAINDGMNQRQLAYLLGIRPQSAGELLAKLENGGQISRQSDEADGRVNRIFLTEEGRKSAEALEKREEREDVFDFLSDDEKKQLEELLGKIVDSHPLTEEEMRMPRGRCRRPFGPEGGFRPLPFEFEERGPQARPLPFEFEERGPQARPMPFHHRRPPVGDEGEDFQPLDEEPLEI